MKTNEIKIIIPAVLENLSLIRAMVKICLENEKVSSQDIFQLLTIVDELSTNVIEHGYQYKDGDLIIEIQRANDKIKLIVEDNGVGFDEEKQSKKEGGMGLFIARTIADDLKIEKKINGTIFKVEKKIGEASNE